LKQTPRELAFCNYTILDATRVLEVPDLRKDERFKSNPLVTSEPHVVFYAGAPLITPKGLVLGSICVLDREEKRLDENQKEALVALAQQVMNSLELRLKFKTLKVTQRKLKSANGRLREYTKLVSHDLKMPICNIRMLTNILTKEHLSNSGDEPLDIARLIQESSSNLLEFIDNLLIRSASNRTNGFLVKTVNVKGVVDKVIRMIAPQHEVELIIEDKFPPIRTDRLLLQQIFHNLIVNAIKYNDKVKPSINISYSKNNSHYSFKVSDNGRGIPVSQLDQIFNKHATLDQDDRYGNKGTGLGLYWIKSNLNKLGGHIEVASVVNEGTSFTFHIPAYDTHLSN
jgi:K+-sensing histidine kinase KdpD